MARLEGPMVLADPLGGIGIPALSSVSGFPLLRKSIVLPLQGTADVRPEAVFAGTGLHTRK